MPKSKKPRKSGKYGMINRKLAQAAKLKSLDDATVERLADDLEKEACRRALARRRYEWMAVLLDHEDLIEGFTRAHNSLKKLPSTTEVFDFNIICSSLMLGAMVHRRLGVEEASWLTDIRRAAFGTVNAYRIRGLNQDLPEANLNMISIGLTAAQDLIEYAFKEDPQALKEVLLKNDPLYTRAHPEENEERERFILGDKYELVRSWKLTRNIEFH